MTFSKYTQYLKTVEPEMYADKLRVTDNADEILKASQGYVNEEPMHERKDDIAQFARGSVLIRIGDNDYKAQVIVGTEKNMKMLLYDVIKIKEEDINEKKAPRKLSAVTPTESASLSADIIVAESEAKSNSDPQIKTGSKHPSNV